MQGLGLAALVTFGNLVGSLIGLPQTPSDVEPRAHVVVPTTVEFPGFQSVEPALLQQTQLPQIQQMQQVQFDAARFDTLTARILGGIFDSAQARGLPTSPLINRALEGAARRVGGPRIVSAVRLYASALSEARDALGPTSSIAELESGASALRSGLDARSLQVVRAARPTGSVEMPLMVLTDFMTRGIPLANAREAVITLSRMPRNSDELLLGLQSTVAKNALRGPGMALQAMNRYVRGTVSGTAPPSTPATSDRKPIRPPSP